MLKRRLVLVKLAVSTLDAGLHTQREHWVGVALVSSCQCELKPCTPRRTLCGGLGRWTGLGKHMPNSRRIQSASFLPMVRDLQVVLKAHIVCTPCPDPARGCAECLKHHPPVGKRALDSSLVCCFGLGDVRRDSSGRPRGTPNAFVPGTIEPRNDRRQATNSIPPRHDREAFHMECHVRPAGFERRHPPSRQNGMRSPSTRSEDGNQPNPMLTVFWSEQRWASDCLVHPDGSRDAEAVPPKHASAIVCA
mmetsp:Transcript_56082/g.114188  ORF Transcript_56082/g.114188 Transcript_56082/m.114188 type:complete len:249 (-) Transcript_56082:130-876(-)